LGGRVDERPGEKDGSEYGFLGNDTVLLVVGFLSLRANGRECATDDSSEQSIVPQAETWLFVSLCPRAQRFRVCRSNVVEGVCDKAAYAAIALARLSETLSRKPVVDSQRWSAPTRSARSWS